MSPSSGSRLGPYEIVAPLGSGGMGEVYRVRDHRLERDVAIKVLPERLAADTQALGRFEREAIREECDGYRRLYAELRRLPSGSSASAA